MNTTTTPSKRATPMTHTLPLRWKQFGALLLAAGLAPSVFAGSLYYYNGVSQQRITPEPTQIAEFAPYGATSAARSASPTKAWKFVTLRAAGPGTADAAGGAKTSPVFREGDSPAGRLMALPGGVIVQFKPDWTDTQVSAWLASKALTAKQRLAIRGNWYVIHSSAGQAALDLANAMHESGEVVSASPNWWKETVTR